MKRFISTLPRNIIDCFTGRRIIFHAAAIVLTSVFVTSGCDWRYFTSTRAPLLRSWMFPAVHIGGLLPIVLPLSLIALGSLARDARMRLVGWAIGQPDILGARAA